MDFFKYLGEIFGEKKLGREKKIVAEKKINLVENIQYTPVYLSIYNYLGTIF